MAQRVGDLCDGLSRAGVTAGRTAQGHVQEALQIGPVNLLAAGRITVSWEERDGERQASGWLPGSWDGG